MIIIKLIKLCTAKEYIRFGIGYTPVYRDILII